MTTPWRKVFRDFWRERTRTLLVVLAIALGISGFATVLAAYAILTRELDSGYLATNPASATLHTDAIDQETLAAIAAGGQVAAVEARRVVTGSIKAGPGEWRHLRLFVVADYGAIEVGKLEPQAGAWPPGAGEILIERDALQVARARIGDTVTVKTGDGEQRNLRVTGSVHDVGQAQARMENIVYGYAVLETLVQLGEEPYLDQVDILVAERPFDEAHIRAVVAEVQALLESRGHPVRRVDVPRPGKHPHADINGLLLLTMAAFGLFVLILSGILVVNLLAGLMASQARQIGMMAAVGGSRRQIAGIYLGQALLLGVAAILIGIPAGRWGGRVLCRYLAVFLNFDIDSFAVPLWVDALAITVGLAVPLLAAAIPVWHGAGISIREALSDHGVARQVFGASWFERALAGLGGPLRPLLLALRNGFRRRTRLALTLLTLSAAGVFFMTAFNVRSSLVNTLDGLFATRRYDLAVGLGTLTSAASIDRAVAATPGIARAESWITSSGTLADASPGGGAAGEPQPAVTPRARHGAASKFASDRFTMIALPAASALLRPNIVAGRGLEAGDTEALVMNTALAAKDPRFRIGNTVAIAMGPAAVRWRVVGLAREPFSPPVAYIPIRYFAERHPGLANAIRLDLERTDAAALAQVRADLDRNLEREGVRALSSASEADSRFGFDQHMLMIYLFLIVMSGVIGGVGGLGLMTTLSLNVMERRREMGVLRAIGASPATVLLIVVVEGITVGVLSWALAALAAWPLSRGVGNLLVENLFKSGLDFAVDPRGPLIWLLVSIVLAAAASLVPAWQAARRPVREALDYQ